MNKIIFQVDSHNKYRKYCKKCGALYCLMDPGPFQSWQKMTTDSFLDKSTNKNIDNNDCCCQKFI